ncbi:MAG: NEW3 domain-containing protein [Candidatus Pacearchaeota archaeon]
MERKEVAVYLYVGVLVLGAVFAVYYFNLGLTGFAVFEQSTENAFNEGTYSNSLYNTSTSAVVLNSSSNETSGTYTSKPFDAGNSVVWNNLTWVGTGVSFEVRACDDSACANETFATADLNNLNATTQYFQYRVLFDSVNDTLTSVSLASTPVPAPVTVSVELLEPLGEKSANTGLPLNFVATGTNLSCSYEIVNSANSQQMLNATITDCANTTFSLDVGGGDYVLTMNVVGNEGSASDTIGFSISIDDEEETSEETTDEEVVVEEVPVEEVPVEPVIPQISLTQITLGEVSLSDVIQGDTKEMSLSVQNSGTTAVTGCSLSGDDSGWITITSSSNNLGAGATAGLGFTVSVPEDTVPGAYALGLSVACAETSASKSFTVNVLQKRLGFSILDVQRTSLGRVRVDYALTELTGEGQDVQMQFFILDASGVEVANASQNSSVDANETDNFRANIAINSSLEGNMTLSVNVNSQQYSVSVREPITLGSPTGFFVLGDDLGTTGNVLAIVVLVVVVAGVYFFFTRRKVSRKMAGAN